MYVFNDSFNPLLNSLISIFLNKLLFSIFFKSFFRLRTPHSALRTPHSAFSEQPTCKYFPVRLTRALNFINTPTSANVIYCITCTLCKKLYIGETGRRLGDRFGEHLCDFEKNDKNASKPVARHFNLANHSATYVSLRPLPT